FSIVLPIKTFVEKKIFSNSPDYEKSTLLIAVFGFLSLTILTVYHIYIKNKYIFQLADRYKERKINKTVLYLIIILIPVTLLLLTATVTVLLNGGQIFGNEINGLLE